MRGDYEAHLAECPLCHSRQLLHRGIDIGLMALASASMIVFLLAYGVIRHFKPTTHFCWKSARWADSCSPCCCGCWSPSPRRLRSW